MSVTSTVAATLRGRITHGELRPGQRLPSERALTIQLGVSRVTVVRALTRLRLEGLVVTRHGSGTFVAATDRLVDAIAARPARPGPHGTDDLDLRWATTAGPADLIQAVQAAVLDALPAELRGDGTTGDGTTGLTERLARYLTRTGLPTRPDQLTLTSGAMTGLALVLDVAAPPGGATVTETPTYPGALRLLSQRKRRVRSWPAGPDGWDPGYLARLLRTGPPGVLYVQPDGHNPTGATMPLETREAIAATAGWLVVADETMRPLHLAQATKASQATTASLAAADHRAIVVSSLSKTVWGGLHLGWIRAPAATTRHLRNAADATGAGPSALDQITAAQLLPDLDAIIQRRAKLLAENLQHLEHRLTSIGHPGLRWHHPTAGVTLWLDLHRRSSHEVVQDCARRGVLLEPASTFAVGGHDDRHLRIPFTAPPATLDRVTDALSQALGPRTAT